MMKMTSLLVVVVVVLVVVLDECIRLHIFRYKQSVLDTNLINSFFTAKHCPSNGEILIITNRKEKNAKKITPRNVDSPVIVFLRVQFWWCILVLKIG
mmetsp:Transcript_3232/g.8954  ORF Transcript_3232/g.8954 Transcript_3232/m.8954 type:complete len:97 (+) Transcript_3232:741-1031(+)